MNDKFDVDRFLDRYEQEKEELGEFFEKPECQKCESVFYQEALKFDKHKNVISCSDCE